MARARRSSRLRCQVDVAVDAIRRVKPDLAVKEAKDIAGAVVDALAETERSELADLRRERDYAQMVIQEVRRLIDRMAPERRGGRYDDPDEIMRRIKADIKAGRR